ncbi:MAG TPA: hypothetical protein VK145_00010 [Candidatus Nanoarchaeia archaeon]|nr:hypothetical protein [Candidatus Nanoarchaeia archaeon]
MAFIFIILYIAIGTILGLGGIDIKRMLARVVIIALLLNFSMFFTKVAIDASNIVTIGFYNQIVSSPSCAATTVGQVGGIGGAFVCKLGITNIFDPTVQQNIMTSTNGGLSAAFKQLLLGVVGSIFISITAFILLAIALMFLGRLIAFIFLIFLSPLAFVSMALPDDEHSSKWKKKLIDNCLMAPVLMAMLWAVLQIAATLPQTPGIGAAIVGNPAGLPLPGMGDSLLNYIILIALISASLMIAKEFGEGGAGGAIKILDKTRKNIQGYVGRNTLGRIGSRIDKNISSRDDGLGRFANTEFGRGLRNITTGALAKGKYGGKLDFGKQEKEAEKANKEYADSVFEKREERTKTDIAITGQRVKDLEKQKEKHEADIAVEGRGEKELKATIAQFNTELTDLNTQQNSDKALLSKTTNASGYAAIKDRIDQRAVQITSLENKINNGEEARILKLIKDKQKKTGEEFDAKITAARQAVDKLKQLTDEEGKELFTSTGKEAEVKDKGEKMGLNEEELRLFMDKERESFIESLRKFDKDKNKNPEIRISLARQGGSIKTITDGGKFFKKALRDGKKVGKKDAKQAFEALQKDLGIEGGGGDDKGEDKEGGDDKGGDDKGKK